VPFPHTVIEILQALVIGNTAHLMRSGSRIAPKIIIRSDVLLMVLQLDHTRENNCSAAPWLDKMAPGLAWTGHMLFLRIA